MNAEWSYYMSLVLPVLEGGAWEVWHMDGWISETVCDMCMWLKGKDLALKVLKRLFLVLRFLSVSTGKIPNFRERKEAKINILEVK